ncbi:NUDIX hydrolase [Limosilactobacillus sp. STM2_1]|uniref:NUDIX hydrolase n=1 Tax=Limosilactobacillus rudii TaxID=2759755 RepID=A0A7W3YML3_9LACO|nr:NUDIX hydrolase [Limosilactobacillus rudii]MBB1078548.1 NUDIX hydrolase [Limosilactobacillus rudii]MBB1097188.1 NUDIX hydrolase [Limosilactobacillus rudii]MCD7133896.1 NUDIX hydrolase [Limosilactobacillus rudii]
MEFAERPISSKTVFHGHLIDVEVQQVITPSGKKAQREIVHHAPAIAILALTDDNKMILEKQWRAPIANTTLEIPAGKLDQRDADNAVHAAKRELNEETRYEATNLKKISSFYTSIGCMDEYMTIYLATGLKRVTHELPQDQDENLALYEITLPKALEMIELGKIEDAKTIMAIYYWQGMKIRG